MFRLFSLNFLNQLTNSRVDYLTFGGNAFGIFLIKPWSSDNIYGSSYSDKHISKIKWWQKIIHAKIYKEYMHFLETGEEPERFQDHAGEWAGIRPIELQFPIKFKAKLKKSIQLDQYKTTFIIEYEHGNFKYQILNITTHATNAFYKFKMRKY